MLHDFLSTAKSGIGVFDEQLAQQIACFRRKVFVELNLLTLDVFEHLTPVGRIKGRVARKHFVDDTSETPPVALLAIRSVLAQYFGREVLGRTAKTLGLGTFIHVFLGKPKISQEGIPFLIN